MPRETICTQPSSPDASPATFAVDVTWGRDNGYVGVMSHAVDGPDRTLMIVNEWLTAAGMPPIDVAVLRAKLDAAGKSPDLHGYQATLDHRVDVNRLITVLRRARDGAFGKDA